MKNDMNVLFAFQDNKLSSNRKDLPDLIRFGCLKLVYMYMNNL